MTDWKKQWWSEYCVDAFATGSRVICNPPVLDTDEDFLLLVDKSVVGSLETRLKSEGFSSGGSPEGKWFFFRNKESGRIVKDHRQLSTQELNPTWEEIPDPGPEDDLLEFPDFSDSSRVGVFHSWKKETLNLIITSSEEYFANFWKATRLATRLNLLKKQDRIMLFEAVTFDLWP